MISSCISPLANVPFTSLHLLFRQTSSSSSVLTQLQAVRVAIRRGGSLQRACGRQLGSPHTQVVTCTSVGGVPTLPFGFALLQNPVGLQSRLFRDWKPPNTQINTLWEGEARGSSPVTGRCMAWHFWFPGRSWQDSRCSCFPLCPWRFPPLECLDPRNRGLCQQGWDLTIEY